MPLRDHFRPPLDNARSWEELHGQWPGTIVRHLNALLPAKYEAGPRVHSGSQAEIDVSTFEKDDQPLDDGTNAPNGGVATAVWAPPQPALAIEVPLPDFDEYEVRIYDAQRSRTLVAAIAIVSPANKDRDTHRNAFVAKCAALVQQGVAVSIVDLVTVRYFNLYAELMAFIGHNDPTLGDTPSHIYAAACRWGVSGKRTLLQAWSNVLELGQPLPTLPLWLSAELSVPLDLELTYEQACRDLRIR